MAGSLDKSLRKNVIIQSSADYHLFKNTKKVIANGDGYIHSFLFNLKMSVANKTESFFIPYY